VTESVCLKNGELQTENIHLESVRLFYKASQNVGNFKLFLTSLSELVASSSYTRPKLSHLSGSNKKFVVSSWPALLYRAPCSTTRKLQNEHREFP